MVLIEWEEKYSVKNSLMDKQHMMIINMINEFYENIKNKSNLELIEELIIKMRKYIIYHFSSEEYILKKYDFFGYEEHKKEHQKFIDKVNDFQMKFKENKLILSFEVTDYLKDWLINHIQGTDMEYADYISNKRKNIIYD